MAFSCQRRARSGKDPAYGFGDIGGRDPLHAFMAQVTVVPMPAGSTGQSGVQVFVAAISGLSGVLPTAVDDHSGAFHGAGKVHLKPDIADH